MSRLLHQSRNVVSIGESSTDRFSEGGRNFGHGGNVSRIRILLIALIEIRVIKNDNVVYNKSPCMHCIVKRIPYPPTITIDYMILNECMRMIVT